jgi:hypothetical protein
VSLSPGCHWVLAQHLNTVSWKVRILGQLHLLTGVAELVYGSN